MVVANAMDPIVKEVETSRAPTLQGALHLHPTGSTSRISSFYGLPTASIATLSVNSLTDNLYHAVCEYASLVPPLSEGFIKPLDISPQEPFEPCLRREKTYDSGSGSDGDDEDSDSGNRRRRMEAPKAPTLRFQWAFGETTIVWPPPPHLEAKYLAEKRKKSHHKAASSADRHVQPMDSADGYHAVETVEKNDLIYLVHYSLDQNTKNKYAIRVILMASPDAAKLRKFAQQVLQWQTDKNFIEPESTQYTLHRFKCDEDGGWWQREGMKRARPPASVILQDNQMNHIIEDVKEFLSSANLKWYIDHGLPHRRCFLFYGPPGTGKTSTVRAIASHFGMKCYFLNMTNSSFSNQKLADAFSQIPARKALLVLEDVDALFNEDRKSEFSKDLSFSGLLNALDGFLSADGVLTVMTTNHVDRLDEALIRAGRVDRKFFFGHPSKVQIENLFQTFYQDASPELCSEFAEAVLARPPEEKAQNFATLQELFIWCRRQTASECIKAVPNFFKTHFPVQSA